ncbi:DUF5058 family protein [Actinopolyspora sp. H202]|uniref:DUF5058 family protein n=1 Tax=Actinopolyspora sp. H202 TaxID=1500456 RepID=UPI003EE52D43
MRTPNIAYSPVLWLAVIGIFLVITVQSLAYLRAASNAAKANDIPRETLVRAFRTGAVSAFGPSLAVVFVAIGLLTMFGTPAVLTRVGLIGSVMFETLAAQTAADSIGIELGGAGYDNSAFALVFFTMSVGGAAWMISALIFTPLLRRTDRKVRSLNPSVMAIVPGAAMIAAFCYLGLNESMKSGVHLITFVTGAVVMLVLQLVAARTGKQWIREWSLGISMAGALLGAGTAI